MSSSVIHDLSHSDTLNSSPVDQMTTRIDELFTSHFKTILLVPTYYFTANQNTVYFKEILFLCKLK